MAEGEAEQLPAPFKLTWEDKFEKARTYKNEGNESFKAKRHKAAIGKYHRALLYLKGIDASKQGSMMPSIFGDRDVEVKMPEAVQKEFVQLKADCYNNLAACLLQTESPVYEKVLQYCDEVLQLSPNNAKAMYRKGVALYNLSRLDDALEELLKAQQQPAGMKDPNIQRHIKLCRQRAELQNKTLRQKYRTMFQRMAQSETPVTSELTVPCDTSGASDMSVCAKSPTNGEDVTLVDRPSSAVTEDVDKPCSNCQNVTTVGKQHTCTVSEDADKSGSGVIKDVGGPEISASGDVIPEDNELHS